MGPSTLDSRPPFPLLNYPPSPAPALTPSERKKKSFILLSSEKKKAQIKILN